MSNQNCWANNYVTILAMAPHLNTY